ncbi:hypothetical protein CYMTET_16295 [Cymbomonas tetramitiformis]|uniref:Uncharacterized protein n=1 Tax=Cymbomonas tetramitiformis TaxID=36881 RepID=A0AAE0L8B1_9CHLO|nr:hypothetical protein CYMTET_16295 [Cymbomonas tetramitiformis]
MYAMSSVGYGDRRESMRMEYQNRGGIIPTGWRIPEDMEADSESSPTAQRHGVGSKRPSRSQRPDMEVKSSWSMKTMKRPFQKKDSRPYLIDP